MTIRVGSAGWHYPDWKGIVYPDPAPRDFHPLRAIASWFDIAEINNSFYRIPLPSHAESWVSKVTEFPNFVFSAKLYGNFTHDRGYTEAECQQYEDFLMPLSESNRLAAILIQFPWSFRFLPKNQLFLEKLLDRWQHQPLVVEFRHDSWWSDTVFNILSERNVSLANIDQPPLKNNILPDDRLTGEIAYVRFHGRHSEAWWKEEEAYYGERYDYLYNAAELSEWDQKFQKLTHGAKSTIIIMNNHHRGDAVVNGLEIAGKFGLAKGVIPKELYRMYPERFQAIGLKEEVLPAEQTDLFGEWS